MQVLPLLNQVNAQTVAHIAGTCAQLREVEEYLKKQTDILYHRIVTSENGLYSVDIELLGKEEPVLIKRVLRQMIGNAAGKLKDIEEIHVLSVYELLGKGVGKQLNLPNGVLARCGYDKLVILKTENEGMTTCQNVVQSLPIQIKVPGTYVLPELGKKISFICIKYEKNMVIPKNSCTKWFDYDKIKNTIFLRTRKPGDFMQINKDGGTKSLKDIFINAKIPKEQRNNIPLLCDGEHVMWITGNRISEAYKVSLESKKILVVDITEV